MLGRWELKVHNCVLRLEDTECYREVQVLKVQNCVLRLEDTEC
jgi:hypothetical protein